MADSDRLPCPFWRELASLDNVDFAAADPTEVPLLEMQIAYVESLARIAAGLGATVVRVFSGYDRPGDTQNAWSRAVQGLREACDRAADHGVTVAVQNHHDLGVHSTAMLELLHEVDRANCGIGFDAWAPTLIDEDVAARARELAPHVVLTTNADYVRVPRYEYRPELVNYVRSQPDLVRAVPFGEGIIDYPAFFAGLTEGGFDGLCAYEICSPIRGGGALENLDRCARQFVDWFAANVRT